MTSEVKLKVGDVLDGELLQWEVLDPDVCVEVAESCVLSRIGNRSDVGFWVAFAATGRRDWLAQWLHGGAVVVYVPQRDVKLALAIAHRGDKFQLLGCRGG